MSKGKGHLRTHSYNRQLGDNITSVNGDVWRTHRRVVAPSFTPRLYNDVWRYTRNVYAEMMSSPEWNGRIVSVASFNATMLRITISVICSCGFGLNLKWTSKEDAGTASASKPEFPEALRIASETFLHRLLIPAWAFDLPFRRLREIRDAWNTVIAFIYAAIDRRREDDPDADIVDGQNFPGDILNRLVMAWARVDKKGLSKDEVLADMLTLVFAGHETSGGGLAATFAYLALNPAIQERAFEEISRTFAENNPEEQIDLSQLNYTFCCFLEGLRLVPSAFFMPRRATEDIVLHVKRPQPAAVPIKKGTLIMIDLIGIHRNPHYFDDPDTYRPERWQGLAEHDNALFGLGSRACIGRKFAQTEVMCFIASFLRDWKVEPLFGKAQGETRVEWEENVLGQATLTGTAFALKNVPLKFVRRDSGSA